MKKIIVLSLISMLGFVASCGDEKAKIVTAETTESASVENAKSNDNPTYDSHRGEGKFTEVVVGNKLDSPLAESGSKTFDVKCSACHKLSDEKLVGPGWLGVTKRREPSWILNFITNTDVMINKDPQVQAMLELCLVRMPNQSLTDDEAKGLLEFMRKNDGIKP